MAKKILVTLPLSEDQKAVLESRPEGGVPCTFIYIPDNEVTRDNICTLLKVDSKGGERIEPIQESET